LITHPKAEELTLAVSRWLEDIRPGLDPRNAFLSRVAANILAVVTRELQSGEAVQAQAAERLTGLLGHGGGYAELTVELCEQLRTGAMDAATPGLLPALRANTLEQLAIDQPGYRHSRS
jgi:hypothetical protein